MLLLTGSPCAAVHLRVDYSQDGSGFFNASTSNGQQARAALEAAAAFYSGILTDSLASVSVPGTYFGSGGGIANFYLQFASPSDPFNQDRLINLASYTIAQDEYVIFAGGASLGDSQLASAGLGWSSYDYSLLPADVPIVEGIYDDFRASYETRGQSSGFAHWGGTISFDNDGSTNWNLDSSSPPGAGQNDLYSVALHEMGHVLGFSRASMEEESLINGVNQFVGATAMTEFGAPIPLQPNGGHWAEGTASVSVTTGAAQETLYDPSFNGFVRKELTMLDAAGLADLGWSVALPDTLPGDFNGDWRVDAADYSVWRDGLGGLYGPQDYFKWRQNYGRVSASSSLAPATGLPVPAPAGLALLASLLPALARR